MTRIPPNWTIYVHFSCALYFKIFYRIKNWNKIGKMYSVYICQLQFDFSFSTFIFNRRKKKIEKTKVSSIRILYNYDVFRAINWAFQWKLFFSQPNWEHYFIRYFEPNLNVLSSKRKIWIKHVHTYVNSNLPSFLSIQSIPV